jgi:hypothetical protein
MNYTEAEFLDKIQTKVLRVFLLAIHSTSTACLEISSNSCNLLSISTVQLFYTVKEKGGKPDRKPYPLPHVLENYTETSSLRILDIMQRNLFETVLS